MREEKERRTRRRTRRRDETKRVKE